MKRTRVLLVCAFICLLLTLNAYAGCLGEAAEAPGKAVRTILLYHCGSDLEGKYGMASFNLCQILESEITDDVNVLVMTGGAKAWQTEAEYLDGEEVVSPNQENQVWLCSGRNAANAVNGHGRMTLLKDMPSDIEKTLMSDPQTLLGFINYAAEKYPAEMYDLILWDHGGGPVLGYGMDDRVEETNLLSVGAIAKTLKQSAVGHFDIVDFDACLMGSVEIAAALSECADYLILSPETEPGYGQEYVTWLDALAQEPDMNGYALGRIIVDAMIAFYENEDSEGYNQDGTLTVIDTRNFRDRMVASITELAGVMDRELTKIGEVNALLNFEDELRSQASTYEYAYSTLLDLGNFAEHLGMCISEVGNTDSSGDFMTLRNQYTDTTENLKQILYDNDGSGDDVMYAAATATMTRPVKTKVAFTRDENGEPQLAETMAPSGLSVFFTYDSLEVMDYILAVDEMCEAIEDEQTRAMLRALEVASMRYLLAEQCGLAVSALREDGYENVYYKTVRDEWQRPKERGSTEIEKYLSQANIRANITGMASSDWDVYISTVIELLNRYSDVDTETWLALLAAQQSSQLLDCEKATVIAVDKTGDGVEDDYRVTVPAPLNLVRDVSTKLTYDFVSEDEDWEMCKSFLGISDEVIVGTVHGNPVQQTIVEYTSLDLGLGSAIRDLFSQTECAYDLPAAVGSWYEILDSEGIGHMISVDEVDLTETQDLRIPVVVHFAEPSSDGTDLDVHGFLVYGAGHFKGFQPVGKTYPPIPLDNSAFYGATIQTCAIVPLEMLGGEIFIEISDAFALPEGRDGDRGMKLVMTQIEDIKDLENRELKTGMAVTDIYGKEHDISAALDAAREEAAAGNVTYSIEAAEITVPQVVFNGRRQEPEVTVKIGDKVLETDSDYMIMEIPMLKAGMEQIYLFGMGDYIGYTTADFIMVPADSTVDALAEVSLSELEDGDVTVLTVNTPAHRENVSFDFSGTGETLRKYLKAAPDGKTVVLEKGAEPGSYEIRVSVVDGGEDTYSNIDGESFAFEVK